MNAFDNLRAAIQAVLDAEGDGYHLAHYLVVMGIQKMDCDGSITNAAWIAVPTGQAAYITDGLLNNAEEMRAGADIEDD